MFYVTPCSKRSDSTMELNDRPISIHSPQKSFTILQINIYIENLLIYLNKKMNLQYYVQLHNTPDTTHTIFNLIHKCLPFERSPKLKDATKQ